MFELARGGLVKRGLGLDRLDVGAVLNVFDNHLGLDGVRTREDLARVKRLVVENARDLAVLNADDPLCLDMRSHIKSKRLGLVSMREDNEILRAHADAGGLVGFVARQEGEVELVIRQGKSQIGRIPAVEIPASWAGRYRAGLSNALFAAMLAHGMGVEFEAIRSALSSFGSTYQDNPGRMNMFEALPYRVLCTHADGPEALAEIAHFARHVAVEGRRLLVLEAAGDRSDDFLRSMGRVIQGVFDHLVCTDGYLLRGRVPGEITRLLAEGCRSEGMDESRVHRVPDPKQALDTAHALARPGDLLVVIAYPAESVWEDAEVRARSTG